MKHSFTINSVIRGYARLYRWMGYTNRRSSVRNCDLCACSASKVLATLAQRYLTDILIFISGGAGSPEIHQR